MPLATAFIPSTSSASPRIGVRHLAGHPRFHRATATRPRGCECTAATVLTRRWTGERSPASIRPWQTLDSPTTPNSDKRCTITLHGRRQRRCPAITALQMMCPTISRSPCGPGTDALAALHNGRLRKTDKHTRRLTCMLTRDENELLARVGQGTAGGAVFRQYWLPAFPSEDLGGPDSDPVRIRLLGEDLIAFRDSSGRVGIVANNCPHRGASLFFGRNEENGLRCVYHGWKFDTSGACVDMPNEPAESDFKVKVKAVAYPTVEQGGVVFVYMGAEAKPPALPRLEWTLVPENQRYISMRWEYCNWAQALEGGIDSSHSSFLHSRLNPEEYTGSQRRGLIYKTRDTHPRFEVVDTEYGVLIGARRNAEEDSYYWRITQFLMPFYQMIPPYGENPPLTAREVERMQTYPTSGIHVGHTGLKPPQLGVPFGWRRPTATRDNDYEINYEVQKKVDRKSTRLN